MQTPKQDVQVYRCGKWEQLTGEALLVGDLISIARPSGAGSDEKVVPADCLILGGTCIVEEAVLTGESTPQWKVSITEVSDPKSSLNIKLDKNYVLFGGTKLLQHTCQTSSKIRTPDGGCLAVVLRTGFETAQGRLMRTILFSTERVTANSLEAGAFILFLLIFAVSAAYYVLKHGLEDPTRDRFKLVLNCVMIITSVIPPELPMELSMAVNASLLALSRKRVFCTEPFRITFAGKVEVCCFDKTGTLTSNHLLLEDVVGPGKGGSCDTVLASCHSLMQIDGVVVGDPLEKAALEVSRQKVIRSLDASYPLNTFMFHTGLLLAVQSLQRCSNKSRQSHPVIHPSPLSFQLECQTNVSYCQEKVSETRGGAACCDEGCTGSREGASGKHAEWLRQPLQIIRSTGSSCHCTCL
jgi:cation-transporting ATPase 13A1